MSTTQLKSADLIDGVIRTCFGVEPEVLAELARGDEQVRLRYPHGLPASPDPLDGVEVFTRSIIATSLALQTYAGEVSLLTEAQARDVGFPSAKLGNLALILAWALRLTKPADAVPVLLEPDVGASGHVLQLGRDLPAMDALRETFAGGWSAMLTPDLGLDEAGPERETGPGRRHVSLTEVLRTMFGVDAHSVDLPADDRGPQLGSASACAVCYLAWVGVEMLDIADTLEEDMIMAVRIKTDEDAMMAEHPGALASNFALLLAAAINHGAGCTVHVLPPDDSVAADLIRAGQEIAMRNAISDPALETEVVDLLALEDLAARRYVHVGRVAREHVAQRLYDSVSAAEG